MRRCKRQRTGAKPAPVAMMIRGMLCDVRSDGPEGESTRRYFRAVGAGLSVRKVELKRPFGWGLTMIWRRVRGEGAGGWVLVRRWDGVGREVA